MSSVTIEVPIKPVPKGRPRVANGHAYTPARTRKFEDAISFMARSRMSASGLKPFESNVYVTAMFIFKTTKAGLDGCPNGTTTSDIDNLSKAVLDALNGICYKDDRQIVRLVAYKCWGHDDCVRVAVSDESEPIKLF